MLLSLEDIAQIDKYFIPYKNYYDNYHIGLYVAWKYTRCWTAINVGLHYRDAIDVYQRFFKKMVGFEPDKSFTKLQQHVKDLEYNNVTLHNIPLSDVGKERTFWTMSDKDRSRTEINPNLYLGGCSLNFNWATEKGNNIVEFVPKKVYTQRLDYILSKTKVKNVDLIKIDAEKEDSRIVYGSENTINRWRPVIQIEYCDKKCEKFLNDKNYVELEFDVDLRNKTKSQPDRWFVPEERL